MRKESILYEKADDRLRCLVCSRKCLIPEGGRGYCLTRENSDGKIYSLTYGEVSSEAVDPIEKKPLFHFYPGSLVYSLGSVGCNFRCRYCQNWSISQARIDGFPTKYISPEEAVENALRSNCTSIAWTYNEPTMWLEYTLDSAERARAEGLKTVYVTNGYMSEEALNLLGPLLDAANVDLKGMSGRFYRELCDAKPEPVLENIIRMHEMGIHIEVTNLLIPGYNDSDDDIVALVNFMVSEVGVEVPLHFTRFFPHYRMQDVPPTGVERLMRARELALEAGMKYVYVGNLPGTDAENTYCPVCGELLIKRDGYLTRTVGIRDGKCSSCRADVDIVID
ncbi:AmmeMemoRadiSam system radical SAM enzyme [Methanothermobacter sp. KEPCO-1]|uniref:AmmeMemoRadiSam system radical SAM enzyme n=1 Tax=Methanothermobacter sp. KEPCO-1 TaxID=2603820 RepID=UPI0011CA6AE4|nr:AmmeMemoRadiSam system radical SAM enzyme [Methanothermobacter sp. KEPCO-1]QEF94497.1 AmmeMemoRadiSam system radical SAM enzyme [Methanothermobacter sp. KEPCO-1]